MLGAQAPGEPERQPATVLPCELELRRSAVSGEVVDASAVAGGPPVAGEEPSANRRIVRAEFLTHVLTEQPEVRAVVLRGARITGTLDLETRTLRCPLVLDCCQLDDAVNVRDATASIIRFHRCALPALIGERLSARQLELDGCRVGTVSLVGARVSAVMSLRYVEIEPRAAPGNLGGGVLSPGDAPAREALRSGRIAVNADRLIAGAVAFDGCVTKGEVRLVGARVEKVSFSGAQLAAKEGPALSAEGIQVAEDMLFWRDPSDRWVPFRSRGQVRLTGARVRTLSMNAADLASAKRDEPALVADGITVEVGFHMDEGFTATGVRLVGADVHVLSLLDAKLDGRGDVALLADRLTVRSGMFCSGLRTCGEVSMRDAQVEGVFDISGAHLANGHGRAFCADGLRLDGSLRAQACELTGTLLLRGAQVTGVVDLEQAMLQNAGKPTLQCDQLIAGGVTGRGCTIVGMTELSGAKIHGRLRLQKSILRNPAKTALEADELTVDDEFQCDAAEFHGAVFLRGASVSMASFKDADFSDVRREEPDAHVAFKADGMSVRRDLFFDGATAQGTIALVGAHVAVLSLNKATFTATAEGASALDAADMTVDRGVFGQGLSTHGRLVLNGCRIGGQLDLARTALRAAGGASSADGAKALELRRARIGGLLRLGLREPAGGAIDLRDAKMGTLDVAPAEDSPLDAGWQSPERKHESWPPCCLADCTYDTLRTAGDRRQPISWLAQDPGGYAPQPYEQLADVYRRAGDDEAARRVLIAKQRERREQALTSWPAKGWSWFLAGTVRYGYRLWLAGVWLIALAFVASLLFGVLFEATTTPGGDLTPAKPAPQAPPFQPVLYAIDVLLPVVSLGQDTGWNAHGAAHWITAAGTLFGWLLTTAFIAGLIARRG